MINKMMSAHGPLSKNVIDAFGALLQGNRRFSSGLRSIETMLSALRMKDLAENGQNPFAIIVTCSDSRLPAEMVFDRGVGDLFVIRMAGNVVTPEVIASIEFAALQFKTPLCVVMGHSKCGAMSAAHEIVGKGGNSPTPFLGQLIEHVREPYQRTASFCEKLGNIETGSPQFLSALTHQNIQHGVSEIVKRSEALSSLASAGNFVVVGAYYDLHEGRVDFDVDGNPSFVQDALGQDSK